MNLKITETGKGLRLDKFLTGKFPQYSRAYLQKMIKGGNILVNSKKVKQRHILKENDEILVEFPEKKELSLKSDSTVKFEVIYEDKNVIVVNKPAGLSVHPSENEPDRTLINGLLAKYPEIKNVGDPSTSSGQERLRPGIVHRLDKDTSGVMIVARNNETFIFLKNQFKERQAVKKYIALAVGNIQKEKGIISLPIARRRNIPTRQVAVKSERQARGKIREAVTEYRVLRHLFIDGKECTLIEAFPKTGRLHQIRVHFSAIGYPLAGDKKYGSGIRTAISGLKRHFLHAASLEITIPQKGIKIFEAPLPQELSKFLE